MASLAFATNRIRKELAESKSNQPTGIKFGIKSNNLFEWAAEIVGPSGTPYEGGTFKFDVTFTKSYPHKPPKITCRTRIYHSNINTAGTICLDVLKEKWSPMMTIRTALLAVQQLLGDPNPSDPLMWSVAEELINSKEEHDRKAKLWTQRYALPQ